MQSELSERQKECLNLVHSGVTASKAISARTGLSPSSIDNYLSRAAGSLGARDRIEAAQIYAGLRAKEEASVSGSVSRIPRLPKLVGAGLKGIAAGVRWLFSVPPIGGRKHRLNRIEITFLILKLATVSLAVFVVIVLIGAGLLWVLR